MKQRKVITLPEIKKVVGAALSHFNINKYLNSFSESEIISLCQNADPDVFTDISVSDNDIVQANFPWNRVRPKRLSRMMSRAIDLGYIDLLEHIDTKGMKIHVKDLRALLRRRPEMIERFSVNLSKLNEVEAFMLLELGKPYFLERINIRSYKFSSGQQFDICKAYKFDRSVLSLFACKRFDGFQTREIMKNKGLEVIDLLDPTNLKLIDWIDLLSERMDVYTHCNALLYRQEPISQLISLAVMTNDDRVYEMIKAADLNEISPFGWEKLMLHRPELFGPVCDYKKLDALNRKNVLSSHPHLLEMIRTRS